MSKPRQVLINQRRKLTQFKYNEEEDLRTDNLKKKRFSLLGENNKSTRFTLLTNKEGTVEKKEEGGDDEAYEKDTRRFTEGDFSLDTSVLEDNHVLNDLLSKQSAEQDKKVIQDSLPLTQQLLSSEQRGILLEQELNRVKETSLIENIKREVSGSKEEQGNETIGLILNKIDFLYQEVLKKGAGAPGDGIPEEREEVEETLEAKLSKINGTASFNFLKRVLGGRSLSDIYNSVPEDLNSVRGQLSCLHPDQFSKIKRLETTLSKLTGLTLDQIISKADDDLIQDCVDLSSSLKQNMDSYNSKFAINLAAKKRSGLISKIKSKLGGS